MNGHSLRYRLLLVVAGGVVMWERLWRRLWPAATWAGMFLVIALLDLMPRLSSILHITALVVFAGVFGVLCYRGMTGLGLVDKAIARRRIEKDSGFEHRPLGALDDRFSASPGDTIAETLWQEHLNRIAQATEKLRLRLPSPGLIRIDRYAVRVPVMLLLVIALAAAGGDAPVRLKRALNPQFDGGGEIPVGLEIWITPPAYTKTAPMFFNLHTPGDSDVKTINIPAGSELMAHANGLSSRPWLVIGSSRKTFEAIGNDGYQVKAMIEKGNRIAVETAGNELASWPIKVVADNPPEISFSAPPRATDKAWLRIKYKARDDYGVSRVAIVIRLDDNPPDTAETRIWLPFSGVGSTKVNATNTSNLSAHPWAGMAVAMQLEAVDGRGQKATSKIIRMRLPELKFNHPVARAIIKQRHELFDRHADRRSEVTSALRDIMADTGSFADNTVVYLSLGVAGSRLTHGRWPDIRQSVGKLLWNTALKIEDGDISIAGQRLESLQQKLLLMLDDKQSLEDMEGVLDKIAKAMDQYLSAISRKIGQQKTIPPMDMQSMNLIRGNELKAMLERVRKMLRVGSIDTARKMLEELQRITDNIRVQDGPSAGAENAYRIINRLRSIGQLQGKLLDQTFRLLGSKTANGKMKSGEYADKQDKLRLQLGDLMVDLDEALGNIPESLGKAEQAMRTAAKALASNMSGQAVRAETEASDQLRQSLRDVAGKIARQFGSVMNSGYGNNRDPFGRLMPGNGGKDIGSFKIPKVSHIRRSDKILRELRRRAGEVQRKKPERDYINRLLRQF